MCSDDVLDAHRFMHVLDAEIEAGGAKRYKPYTAWAKRVAARPRPAPRAAAKKRAREAAANQELVEAIRRAGWGGVRAAGPATCCCCRRPWRRRGVARACGAASERWHAELKEQTPAAAAPPAGRRCRQRSAMGGLVASLSAKYGANEEGHEDAPYPEPSEADFEAARRRLEAKQGKAAAAPKESKKEGKKEGRAHAKKKK
jgi:DnaJ family protein C protein 9